ncbi:glycosyltransferase [Myroides sp. M-43]|uniref:glycosyltransferase family 2 protein n=1 Tax=Myroides oncorhynchi TaxID=2893756 RepID=UPI001E2F77BA|nr:glycosyltransferase [Myroides oncorhynchi]MCC9041249.1 glycosyltransferase [Myroides oncorhynchi]
MREDKVTFVLTSCNRFDLLKLTIASFLKYNTCPIEKYIFIEDSEKIKSLEKVVNNFPELKGKTVLLHNPVNLGQLKSIDRAYSLVDTEYIFHCEEDWIFYRSGFIEDSIEVLKASPKILNIWLRERTDTNHCKVLDTFEICENHKIYRFDLEDKKEPFAFTFNPTVKRLSDYKMITGGYANSGMEDSISKFYEEIGYYAVVFETGYVKHEGWHRRVLAMEKQRSKLQKEFDAGFKKYKAKIYKLLGIFGKGK